MRENLTYGSMRGNWKPGTVHGLRPRPKGIGISHRRTYDHGA